MTAFDIPFAHAASVSAGLVDLGVTQRGALGGGIRRFSRPGSHHQLQVQFPPLTREAAGPIVGGVLHNLASGDPVRFPWPQIAESYEAMYPLVNGASQTGQTLNVYNIAASERGNRFIRSGDLTHSGQWSPVGVSVLASPDSQLKRVIPSTSSTIHYVVAHTGISVTSANVYTIEVDAAPAGYDWLIVLCDTAYGSFNVRTGALGSSANATLGVTRLTGGKVRLRLTFTASATATPAVYFGVNTANGTAIATYAGDGLSGIDLGRAHFHTGANAVRYSPTTTTASVNHIDAGRAFHLEISGRRYLYVAAADAPVLSGGFAAVDLDTMIRASPANGDALEINFPMIEGIIAGDGFGWSVERAIAAGLGFTIEEAA
jgi:hypothetical protein